MLFCLPKEMLFGVLNHNRCPLSRKLPFDPARTPRRGRWWPEKKKRKPAHETLFIQRQTDKMT